MDFWLKFILFVVCRPAVRDSLFTTALHDPSPFHPTVLCGLAVWLGQLIWCWICWNSHRRQWLISSTSRLFHTEELIGLGGTAMATSAWFLPWVLPELLFLSDGLLIAATIVRGPLWFFLSVSLDSSSPWPAPWIGNGFLLHVGYICLNFSFISEPFYLFMSLELNFLFNLLNGFLHCAHVCIFFMLVCLIFRMLSSLQIDASLADEVRTRNCCWLRLFSCVISN